MRRDQLIRQMLRLSTPVRRLLLKDHWFLTLRRRDRPGATYRTMDGYVALRPPRDRYYADPFVIKGAGGNYLFFEEFRFDRAKGSIACAPLTGDGCLLEPRVVLECPYHLSFPFVFAWAGNTWMIPESSANRTIELYRAERFPDVWVRERVLMSRVHASDTVLLLHHDRAWLFTSIRRRAAHPNGELFLFHADSPLGEWVPHPRNPVVADPSRARPAGRIFADGGNLIRPGQDCSRRYGEAVQFCSVTALNRREYEEVPCWRSEADWAANLAGTHTYNSNDDFEVRDVYEARLDPYGKWLAVAARGRRMMDALASARQRRRGVSP